MKVWIIQDVPEYSDYPGDVLAVLRVGQGGNGYSIIDLVKFMREEGIITSKVQDRMLSLDNLEDRLMAGLDTPDDGEACEVTKTGKKIRNTQICISKQDLW